ncbi:type II secretion system protein [Salinarchaeum sp. Harcht-Bsk1]|uniref:type II/IV secretion system ATPase subunit n=1 Tax=Salinarchaeum sp. Harcht-Bsk1 TaxID=1333523 RepID=UPI0003423D09|nr:type II/IV secretion system ATPase subunit [Salinarchaeum sp. Harcht-Bsk1]AGN01327.1 type II secretion system protein [Salinarchaeum sp. Harcht-Bsk1]
MATTGSATTATANPAPPVPAPVPPDDPDAWYAPDVREQTELCPGVVATIEAVDESFAYRIREPALSPGDEERLATILDHFGDATLSRPLTREGTREQIAAGFDEKYRRAIERLVDATNEGLRRVGYYALRDLRCLGELTPLALDQSIEVADAAEDALIVHTEHYAPAVTDLPGDPDFLDRFVSERLDTYTVAFREFEIPVVVYQEHLIGSDAFTTKYAVREPDLLPGDEALVEECKTKVWETNVDGVVEDRGAFVRERARLVLSRLLTARNTRAWFDATRYRVRSALATYDLAIPPIDDRFAEDRLEDLVYYVLRDYVGEGKLTIPIRDVHLEDIEANRVGERVKVVPRSTVSHDRRMPTNLVFEDETAFVNVVRQLAAADGVELNAANPSAKVNLAPEGVDDDVTIRCAVALPVISEDGPHVSIRKQAPEALTPVDLMAADSISPELVALLWQLYEHRCVVLFSGPTGAGKTTLMNAHMPFVRFEDRPISIDEGSREVRLPHETGVSLTTRDHEDDYKRVTMADLMTECNYLNPDIEVIAEINTPASFETFGETLNTGHGLVGTTHAEDVEKLVNRVVEQGLPPYLLREIDLVAFPKHVDGERYVGEVIEFLGPSEYVQVGGVCGAIEKGGSTIYWNRVAERDPTGTFHLNYDHPELPTDERASADLAPGERLERSAFDPPDNEAAVAEETDAATGAAGTASDATDPAPSCDMRVFHRIADRTDRPVQTVEAEFHRKLRYVRYLQREGLDDFEELFAFVADLETNEAATVERLRRRGVS